MTRLSRCLAASLALLPALPGVALADHPVARDSGFRLALRPRQDNSTSTVSSASLDSASASTSASASPTDSSSQFAPDASNATPSPTSASVDSAASYPPSTATDSAGFVGPTGMISTYVQESSSESSCVTRGGGSSVRGGINSSSDLTVLQLAYVLESLESTLYSRALSTFSTSDFDNAGLSQVVVVIIIEQIGSFLRDEQAHIKALESAIIALGAQPFQGCSFNFGRALSDPLEFLAVARAVEAVGQAAYLGAAHLVSDPSLLTAAGSILTVEARHQSFLNLLSGATFEAQAFDLAFSPSQVLALVGGFLQGCQASDFGLTANQPLSVVDGRSGLSAFLDGSRIEFITIVQIDVQVLFCQMIIGGAPVALVLPAHSCIVPSGISGPVSVYLTSTSQPLASSTIIQNTAVIVAGPALIFVDVQITLLSSLFSSFSHGNGRYGTSRSLPSADLGGYAVRAVKEGTSSAWSPSGGSSVIPASTAPSYRLDRRRKNKARTLFEDLSP
ncbi:stress response protein Rds2p [Rhodotorula toruloides]|uniref:Stress response protein Rds2p n=1 Tax=Rhodotorula toruloides TaxID=5286 RepID=A0A511KIS9_RHOTO|nr:stress response protein Rds2p [Rhodotorula toruloides]